MNAPGNAPGFLAAVPEVICPTLPGSEAARVRLAAAGSATPAQVTMLAADPSVTVRAALAMNPILLGLADQVLARDPDERVRLLLGRKLAAIAPRLAAATDDPAGLPARAFKTLAGLVEDEAIRVRAAIAEVLRDMPDAPRTLILRLAQDAAAEVAEPVIRFSPLLSAEDLLALLAGARGQAMASAIARRPDLAEPVSDAIAVSADSAAICALLANRSAQIREATLDSLIARAADHADWHAPLVDRPVLTARAARALSEIVSAHLLAALGNRPDLDPYLADDLQRRLNERLAQGGEAARLHDDEAEIAAAHAMAAADTLSEAAVLASVGRGAVRAALVQLAVAAEMPVSVIDRAVTLRSAKGLVSLIWRAGFSMRLAMPLQTLVGLSPAAILPAGPGGGFPLAIEEMRWQLEFLGRMGR